MALIKIRDIVINTNYIAAVNLEGKTYSGERSVSILIAAPKFPLFQLEETFPNPYHYEWLDFIGQEAIALRDYFSSCNNVIDLLPQFQQSTTAS